MVRSARHPLKPARLRSPVVAETAIRAVWVAAQAMMAATQKPSRPAPPLPPRKARRWRARPAAAAGVPAAKHSATQAADADLPEPQRQRRPIPTMPDLPTRAPAPRAETAVKLPERLVLFLRTELPQARSQRRQAPWRV